MLSSRRGTHLIEKLGSQWDRRQNHDPTLQRVPDTGSAAVQSIGRMIIVLQKHQPKAT